MNNYLSLNQAAQRIESLCKSIWYFDAPKRDYPHSLDYFKRILAKQPNTIWVSKLTGFLYDYTPNNYDDFLQIQVTFHECKYKLHFV